MVVRRQPGRFSQRFDQTRRDHEQQFRLVFLELGTTEQGAENRYLTQAGETLDGFGDVVLDQTCNDEALPVVKLHGGIGPAHRK